MREFTDQDIRFMRLALKLAERGRGFVEPNPMVGCVIVKGGRVLGEGFHRRFGGPHAEVEALRACSASPRGATVYVSLEPCNIQGKTPPCTKALLAAGVKRVVAAMRDPNPKVSGRGLQQLRRAGVQVTQGVLEAEARELNAPFVKLMKEGRPWVILKWAQSFDGKIATRLRDSKWITDERARADAHRLRGRVDAVMVGVETVLTDDPTLTCRHGRVRRRATRVVLDSSLRTPASSQLAATASEAPVLLFCTADAPLQEEQRLRAAGCEIVRVPRGDVGVDLAAVLDALGARGMANVMVEGGASVLGAFLDQSLADEARAYVAPCVLGGAEALGALGGLGVARVSDARRFSATSVRRLGDGWVLRTRLSHSPGEHL